MTLSAPSHDHAARAAAAPIAPAPPTVTSTSRRGSTSGMDVPVELDVQAWRDPVIERFGHDARSRYVERFWLPIVGPSGIWLLRALAERLEASPDGFRADTHDLARAIGLSNGNGRQAPFARTLERICSFGMARMVAPTALAVRTRVAPLTQRQLGRLPAALREAHDALTAREPEEPGVEAMRRRARALALSLLELGEDVDAAERQLHRWRFHPAIADEAMRWARAEHAVRNPPS